MTKYSKSSEVLVHSCEHKDSTFWESMRPKLLKNSHGCKSQKHVQIVSFINISLRHNSFFTYKVISTSFIIRFAKDNERKIAE